MRYSLCLALFFLALTAIAAVAGGSTKPKGRVEDSAIFREVDDDNDGQLELHEIRKFISEDLSGNDFDTAPEIERGMNEVFENVGHVPIGQASSASTLSSADVEAYWNRMCTQMTVDHVAAWIEHSVQLPQFVDNFRRAAITGCDFPALDSQALQHDLAITSQLHQKQIIRAIQMKLLAVGDEPSAPVGLEVTPLKCHSVRVAWEAASTKHATSSSKTAAPAFSPPVHRYVVERRAAPGTKSSDLDWHSVYIGADDHFTDALPRSIDSQRFEYRVRAWNMMGGSPFSASVPFRSAGCTASDLAEEASSTTGDNAMFSLSFTKLIASLIVIGTSTVLVAHLLLPDVDVLAVLLSWCGLSEPSHAHSHVVDTSNPSLLTPPFDKKKHRYVPLTPESDFDAKSAVAVPSIQLPASPRSSLKAMSKSSKSKLLVRSDSKTAMSPPSVSRSNSKKVIVSPAAEELTSPSASSSSDTSAPPAVTRSNSTKSVIASLVTDEPATPTATPVAAATPRPSFVSKLGLAPPSNGTAPAAASAAPIVPPSPLRRAMTAIAGTLMAVSPKGRFLQSPPPQSPPPQTPTLPPTMTPITSSLSVDSDISSDIGTPVSQPPATKPSAANDALEKVGGKAQFGQLLKKQMNACCKCGKAFGLKSMREVMANPLKPYRAQHHCHLCYRAFCSKCGETDHDLEPCPVPGRCTCGHCLEVIQQRAAAATGPHRSHSH